MEATSPGRNRTGAAVSPEGIEQMLRAVNDLSPPMPISTLQIDVERQTYIAQADAVGSIPPSSMLKGAVKKGKAKLSGVSPSLLLDKLGERIAFERTGTRLYDALISKYLALINSDGDILPPASSLAGAPVASAVEDTTASESPVMAETAAETLRRIRADELRHFHMLGNVMKELGGDPTAQTPCADVTAVASSGLVQVITDPRTTLAQCLNTILTAELTDNAGWELLSQLATEAGQNALAEKFSQALAQEQEHLAIIRGWLQTLLLDEADTAAV
jgi:hypothetical protein